MIAVNSIFASFSGALVAVVVAFTTRSLWVHICVGLLLVAFLLFVHAAESITDALEQDDVDIYLGSHIKYNLGVVLLLISLALILFFQGYRLISSIPVVGSFYPWLRDAYWLTFSSAQGRQEYKNEILRQD
jgi:ABC-type uncharacterized transport system permease subunit